MKFVLMLVCCTLLALAITALPSHQAAAASASDPYVTSEDLADSMSSHGIETAEPLGGALQPVAYRPATDSR